MSDLSRPAATSRGLESVAVHKQALAMQALSKLTRQFADQPDFERLIEVLILTLTGQFSVGNAFSVVRHPGLPDAQPIYFGTGKYRDEPTLMQLAERCDRLGNAVHGGTPYRTEDLDGEATGTLVPALLANRVAVIVPLRHEGELFGLIGLGEKVTRRPFADDELELFATLSNTVTPLLVSSFLFLEIATLNAWYRDILNSVRQGVFVFDWDRRLKKINGAGLDILRLLGSRPADAEAMRGASIGEIFDERTCPGWLKRIDAALRGRRSAILQSVIARAAETEYVFHVRVSTTASAGEAGGDIIVTLEDISEQKANEDRFHNLAKFAERGMMAASIAHELNNFLAMILGGVELAQMVLGMGHAERVQKSLEKVKTTVSRMERFTSGLTDLSRMHSEKKMTQLNDTITDLLSFVTVQRRFQRIHIDTDLDPNLPEREFDRDQVAQLLLNFFNNAADAIAEADRDLGQIQVRTAVEGDRIVVAVTDNGAGMRPEVREQLFKCHLTTKEKGHGYGLVTCARIITDHGGDFTIDSELGQGSTFRLTFPVHTTPSEAQA